MKIEAETFIHYVENALPESDLRKLKAAISSDPLLQREERSYRRLKAAERLACFEADSLPSTFDHSVMRRIRVAVPPAAAPNRPSLLDLAAELLQAIPASPRLLSSVCLAFLALVITPLAVLRQAGTGVAPVITRDLYDPAREQPYMRLVNAVTARIPEGYRAVSLEVAGGALPGDAVDVVWLYQGQKRSTATMVAQNVQVLSTQRYDDGDGSQPGHSTVTLLVPENDTGKIELARSTGQLALSVRADSSTADRRIPPAPYSLVTEAPREVQPELEFLGPDGQVERYIVRDGRLIPRI